MAWFILLLLLVIIVLLLHINSKLPGRDYVKEAMERKQDPGD